MMATGGDARPDTSPEEGIGVLVGRRVKVYPELLRWETHRVARRPDRRWTTLECGADGERWVSGPTGWRLVLYGGGFVAIGNYGESVTCSLFFEAEGDRLHVTMQSFYEQRARVRSICATPETVRALGGHEQTALMWMSAWASANSREAMPPPCFLFRDLLSESETGPTGEDRRAPFALPLVGSALPDYDAPLQWQWPFR